MTSATFRLPGPLAIGVAEVDAMSGGRVELGIGAGWFEEEHDAYGIPFFTTAQRFDRLEESLAVITGLWKTPPGERFSFAGKQFRLEDSPALPKPVQSPRPPVLVGGLGKRRTPSLPARFADEFNVPFGSLEQTGTQFQRVNEACVGAGRDPQSLVYSTALVLCCGRDEAEIARRAARIGRGVEELRQDGLAGTPSELVDKIGRYADLGSTRIYLQTLDLSDLDQLELVADRVMPQLG